MERLKQIFLCLFFLIISQLCSAQIKEGLYIWNFGSGTEQIVFQKNNKFSFIRTDCTGHKTGLGTYKLFDQTLILLFKSDSIDYDLNIDTTEAVNDSVKLDITLYDFQTKTPLNTTINFDKNIGAATDSNGRAYFKFPKSNDTIEIRSVPFKYLPKLDIRLNKNYRITLFLKPNFTDRFSNNDEEKYQIKKISKQGIELKDGIIFYKK
jgi:hypothetical protein